MKLGRLSSRLYRPSSQHLLNCSTRRAFRLGLQRKAQDVSSQESRTRNIGIIAHIDAVCDQWADTLAAELIKSKGKTTTTERMLYYSGHTRRIGSMVFALLVILISSIPRKLVLPPLSQPASPNIRNTPHGLNLPVISFLQSHRCRRRVNSHRLFAGRESSRRNNTVRSHLIPLATITCRQYPEKYDGYE